MFSEELTGKRLLLLALVGVTCFSMGLIYNAENKLFTEEVPTERTFVAPKMASYALRATGRESEAVISDEEQSIWEILPDVMETDRPTQEEKRISDSTNGERGLKESVQNGDGSKKTILKIMSDTNRDRAVKNEKVRIVDSTDEDVASTKKKKPSPDAAGMKKGIEKVKKPVPDSSSENKGEKVKKPVSDSSSEDKTEKVKKPVSDSSDGEKGTGKAKTKSGSQSGPSPGPCYRQVQVWRGESTPQEPQIFDCPGLPCGIRFVQDASYETMANSDALILFHRTGWNWAEMQRQRPPNQLWFFHSRQSPDHTGKDAYPPEGYEDAYNYTISYRPSSTIYAPYGFYRKNKPQVAPDSEINWAGKKKKLMAWVGSNCGGLTYRRQDFVKSLAKRIKVDAYGACGTLPFCAKGGDCWDVIQKYKFYLALENSECRNYITEKFWHNALQNDVVPIVYGAPRKDYERVAPLNSFIHLQDFKSFDEFKTYIKRVDSNDTLYNSYMDWKKQGSVELVFRSSDVLTGPFMCQAVSLVLDNEKHLSKSNGRRKQEHPNIEEFWTNSCQEQSGFPHDFPV